MLRVGREIAGNTAETAAFAALTVNRCRQSGNALPSSPESSYMLGTRIVAFSFLKTRSQSNSNRKIRCLRDTRQTDPIRRTKCKQQNAVPYEEHSKRKYIYRTSHNSCVVVGETLLPSVLQRLFLCSSRVYRVGVVCPHCEMFGRRS